MKKTTGNNVTGITVQPRVEWLVTRWQEEKRKRKREEDQTKLNERMDHWMKEITKEQRRP